MEQTSNNNPYTVNSKEENSPAVSAGDRDHDLPTTSPALYERCMYYSVAKTPYTVYQVFECNVCGQATVNRSEVSL